MFKDQYLFNVAFITTYAKKFYYFYNWVFYILITNPKIHTFHHNFILLSGSHNLSLSYCSMILFFHYYSQL